MRGAKSKKPAAKKAVKKVVAKAVKKPAAKAKPVAKKAVAKAVAKSPAKQVSKTKAKPVAKPVAKPASKTTSKVATKPSAKSKLAKAPAKKPAVVAHAPKVTGKKAAKANAKGKAGKSTDDTDLSDIESDLEGEEVASTEKVKPLRMKISKAKERALMKEFGLDETVLSEEDLLKRRQRLKTLIKLGKTRGYLTHGEISDHLPDKLVDAETLEVVISMLNDMGVAVYEQTPDAETLLLNNTGPTAATEELLPLW